MKIRGTPSTQVMSRSRGHAVFHYLDQTRIVVQKWPRRRGPIAYLHPTTQAQVSAWDQVQWWMKSPEPSELAVAIEMTKNTAFYTRDVLIMAAYGNYISWPGWGWKEKLSTNIQVLLDAVTDVPGSILIRDTSGWLGLAAGPSGGLLTTHGAGTAPTWQAPAAGGAGLWAPVILSVPTRAGSGFTTWLNQPAGATVADAATGVVVFQPSSGGAHTFAALGQTSPTAPYAKTALIAHDGAPVNFRASVIGWSDGTKALALVRQQTTGLYVARFTALAAATETVVFAAELGDYFTAQQLWVRLRDDGTSLYVDVSASGGAYWRQLYTEARTAWLTAPSHLLFGTENYNQPGAATLLSFA